MEFFIFQLVKMKYHIYFSSSPHQMLPAAGIPRLVCPKYEGMSSNQTIRLTQFLWLLVIMLFSATLWFNFNITLIGLGLNLPIPIQINCLKHKLLILYILIHSSKVHNIESYSYYLVISQMHFLIELHFCIRPQFNISITQLIPSFMLQTWIRLWILVCIHFWGGLNPGVLNTETHP